MPTPDITLGRVPWGHRLVAATIVVLLGGMFFLPALHHLACFHHGEGNAETESCAVCLQVGGGVAALPVAVQALALPPAAAQPSHGGGAPVLRRPHVPRASRAPPRSD